MTERQVLGARLKTARLLAGYTLKEAAYELGITPAAVSSWENGYAEPRAINFMTACRIYRTTPDAIFLDNGLGTVRKVEK